jgi:hypothetical protein
MKELIILLFIYGCVHQNSISIDFVFGATFGYIYFLVVGGGDFLSL